MLLLRKLCSPIRKVDNALFCQKNKFSVVIVMQYVYMNDFSSYYLLFIYDNSLHIQKVLCSIFYKSEGNFTCETVYHSHVGMSFIILIFLQKQVGEERRICRKFLLPMHVDCNSLDSPVHSTGGSVSGVGCVGVTA